MSDLAERFKNAKLIDFTGRINGFQHMAQFGQPFVDMVRGENAAAKAVVMIDRAICPNADGPMVVRDHLNLTGDNPLVGPNHPGGDRFPVVQGIYMSDFPEGLASGVAAGLKPGVVPEGDDLSFLRSLGVDFCSYNIVPAMLVAAHAGWKVLAIGLPDNTELTNKQIDQLTELTRSN